MKITKQVEVSVTDFTHNWILPNCATLISSIVEGNIVTGVFDFCDENCIQNFNIITLIVTDLDGCTTSIDVQVSSVCANFEFLKGGIEQVEDCDECTLRFRAPTSDSTSTYKWTYDTSIFEGEVSEAGTLTLNYRNTPNIEIENSILEVEVTNIRDCKLTAATLIDNCTYEYKSFTFNGQCRTVKSQSEQSTGYITPFSTKCPEFTIDFNNTEIISSSHPVTLITRKDNFKITLNNSLDEGTKVKVDLETKDCRGYKIGYQVCFTAVVCNDGPVIPPFESFFGCEDCEGTTLAGRGSSSSTNRNCSGPLQINMEAVLDGNVSWSSFEFIPGLGDTVIDNQTLQTPYGTLSLNSDRVVSFDYRGGILSTYLVSYKVIIDGFEIQSDLIFKGTLCTDKPIAVNDSFCMLTDATTEFINFTLNDSGRFNQLIITQFPSIQVIQDNLKLRFISSSTPVNTLLKYKLRTEDGVESNEAIVDITVNNKEFVTNDISTCLNTELDLNTLFFGNSDIITFKGYTANGAAIPGDLNSPNGLQVGAILDRPTFTPQTAGYYTFTIGDINDSCTATSDVTIEAIEDNGTTDVNLDLCITSEETNLSTLANVEGGTWTYISSMPINNFDGENFNFQVEGVGEYMFRWNKENMGMYNTVPCDSTLVLTLSIKPEPETLDIVCLTYCSYGENPEEDPSCKTPKVVFNTPTTGCEYNLYTEIGAPQGSTIQLINAPYFPIRLSFNGTNKVYNQLDFLPEGTAIWQNGNAPLGSYEFRVTYGSPCTKQLDVEANIYQASCALAITTINVCFEGPTFNILEVATENSNCLISNDISLTLLSQNLAGEGIPTYNLTTGDFSPTVPGEWVFEFNAGLANADPNCEACSTTEEIRIIVNPLPGPGEPNPGTVCNNGECTVPVYPGMFNPNQSILGTFCYDGYSTTSNGIPGIGGWGGVEPTLTPGDISGPSYTFENALAGFYFFSNKVTDANGCVSTSQTIVQVVTSLVAGTGSTLDVCELTPECLNLRDLIAGETAGGNWFQTEGTTNNAFVNCDPGIWIAADEATFNTAGQPVGTYKFKYVTTTAPAIYPLYEGCTACDGGEAEVIINITEAVLAGNGSSQAVCA